MYFELFIPAEVELRQGVRLRALGYWERDQGGPFIAQYADCEDGILYQSPVNADAMAFIGYVADVRKYGGRTRMLFASQTFRSSLSFADQWTHNLYIQVPQLWSAAEERNDLEAALMPSSKVLQDMKWRGRERYDVREVTWALNRQGIITKRFDYEPLFHWFGTLCTRIEGMHRLLNRAVHMESLRTKLQPLKYRSGYKYVSEELLLESTALLEQAAWSAYATLDVFSLIVNHVYGLGRTSLQCHYRAVLGVRGPAEDEEGSSLVGRYPEDDLTVLLLEREEWIAELRSLRHNLAHADNLIPVHGPVPLSAALVGSGSDLQPIYEIEPRVREWTEKLEELLNDAFKIMQRRAEASVEGVEYKATASKPSVKATRCEDQISDVLALLRQGNKDAALFLYSRFGKEAKNQWSFPDFTRFIDSIGEVNSIPGMPMAGSSNGEERAAETTYKVMLSGKESRWHFRSEKIGDATPSLAFRRSEWPPSSIDRFAVQEVRVRQANMCASFDVSVENVSGDVLQDVVVAVYQSGSRWAEKSIGDVEPSLTKVAHMLTSEEAGRPMEGYGMPLMGLLMNGGVVQISYRISTELGACWTEEHSYQPIRESATQINSPRPGSPYKAD